MSYDFIVVGQGLAGTLLTHFLIRQQQSVLVIDHYNPSSSSNIAAGIIHPITGRRLVKTWLFDEAYPFARATYAELEKNFNYRFFKEIPIAEIYSSIKNRNEWMERSGDNDYKNLIGDELLPYFYANVHAPLGGVKINSTGYLLLKKLIEAYRNFLKTNKQLVEEKFSFDELKFENGYVIYKNITSGRIIFCEGYHASENPFFKNLPFRFAKGETLIVKCKRLREDYIINKGIYIQPLGNKFFRVGSTYSWDDLNEIPTEAAKKKLTDSFSEIIKAEFSVEEHHAAVRPAMKERRPVFGLHQDHKQIGILNGFGAKGVLLAPYFAAKFVEQLLKTA